MTVRILIGDVRDRLKELPSDSIDCVVTSPPYWGLRNYGTARWEGGQADCQHEGSERYYTEKSAASANGSSEAFAKAGPDNAARLKAARWREGGFCIHCAAKWIDQQIGLEPTLGEHLATMVDVMREVRRVMKPEATLWLNYGDCYATKPNGRSAEATKAAGNDDHTFRDKPFSTVGPVYGHLDLAYEKTPRAGKTQNFGNLAGQSGPRVVGVGLLKPKDLCMVPNRLAIALQDDGWWVRSEIIWGKPNPMPDSSGRYRPSTAHEKIWLLTKSGKSFYDREAVKMPAENPPDGKMPDGWDTGDGAHGSVHREGREKGARKIEKQRGHSRRHQGFNDRWDGMTKEEQGANGRLLRNYEPAPWEHENFVGEVWDIPPSGFREAHFATFPPALVEPCIAAGCPKGGTVLDPFGGAGTTGMVADRMERHAILIELNPEYAEIARRRIHNDAGMFAQVAAE